MNRFKDDLKMISNSGCNALNRILSGFNNPLSKGLEQQIAFNYSFTLEFERLGIFYW